MKYIFVVGAPGSKWSSVCKNIYYSPSIDRSDYNEANTYTHTASGTEQLMHLGAYFDPGMEYGNFFDRIDQYSKLACETEFDRPFTGTGIRIIKSHVLSNFIPFLKANWPDCPIVLVYRPNDACLGWWVRCGHFNITYPNYLPYYRDLNTMATIIDKQNADIVKFLDQASIVYDNQNLAEMLGIKAPPSEYKQVYADFDIKVKVLR
jgi:hypothetical protein